MSDSRLLAHLSSMIVDSSDDAIVGMALDGTIVSWNPAAERLFGKPRLEAVGRPLSWLWPAARAAEPAALLESVRRGERVRRELALRKPGGGELDVSLTLSPVTHGGQPTGASAILRDMSDRRALEKKLRDGQVLESLGLLAGGRAAPP